jgi:hypothetical protein
MWLGQLVKLVFNLRAVDDDDGEDRAQVLSLDHWAEIGPAFRARFRKFISQGPPGDRLSLLPDGVHPWVEKWLRQRGYQMPSYDA